MAIALFTKTISRQTRIPQVKRYLITTLGLAYVIITSSQKGSLLANQKLFTNRF